MQTPPKIPAPAAEGSPPLRQKPPAWLYKRLGNYRLLDLLGQGAVGKVFRAEDLQLARQVALKAIPIATSQSRLHTVEQVLSEARLAAALEHPNIVRVYEIGKTPQVSFIAMELVEGGNLKDLVGGSGPLDYVRACQLVAEAADALAYSHAQGIIHRDVKPANLMLGRGGRCKLADFGLAVLRQPGSDGEGAPGPAGTPQFVPPEVIRGETAGPRSDLYSLGATLWYLLVGSPPFVAERPGQIMEKHLNEPLPDLAKLRPDLPKALVRAVSKALAKDPAERPEDMEQFARLLRVHTIVVGSSGSSATGMGYMTGSDAPAVAGRGLRIRGAVLWSGFAAVIGTCVAVTYVYWVCGGASRHPVAPAPMMHLMAAAPAPHATAVSLAALITPGALRATDTPALSRLASGHGTTQPAEGVIVEGIVALNQVSKHGKYFRITFEGNDEDNGFNCVYKPEVLPALQKKFGGSDGLGLPGKRIRVTGQVDLYKDRPTIHIESASQIAFLP